MNKPRLVNYPMPGLFGLLPQWSMFMLIPPVSYRVCHVGYIGPDPAKLYALWIAEVEYFGNLTPPASPTYPSTRRTD